MSADDELVAAFERFQADVVLETSDHALSTLNSMVASGSIDLSPQFQRRDRWDAFKQSGLIESFVLNIPVPPIYLAEGARGTYDVIDGKQRLTAVGQFLSNRFPLRGIDRFPELAGLRFMDLPPEIKSTLNFRPLRTVTLLRQSSPSAKYEVFHRLNSGGQVLNAQEIRNVLFRGPLNDLVFKLSTNRFLRTQLKITSEKAPAYKNMTDVEWVLRFLTVRDTWRNFSGDYRKSMDLFMEDHQNASSGEMLDFRTAFTSSIQACEQIFGSKAFKRPEGQGWRDQALAGLYDAEMVGLAEVSSKVRKEAVASPQKVISGFRTLFRQDEEFEQATRQATNTPARVAYRVERMIDLLENA